MKRKIKQKKSKPTSNFSLNYKEMLVMIFITLFLVSFSFFIKKSYDLKKYYNNNYSNFTFSIKQSDIENVEIITDKNVYFDNEKIKLVVKNNEKQSIYFEPCEYLNDFEKKIDGVWQKESIVKGNNYNKFSFNKNKSETKCKIELPKSGEGKYRSIIQIYYKCQKPGYDTCQNSKIFYSNEFEVKNSAIKQ